MDDRGSWTVQFDRKGLNERDRIVFCEKCSPEEYLLELDLMMLKAARVVLGSIGLTRGFVMMGAVDSVPWCFDSFKQSAL